MLSENIKTVRKAKGLSQEGLAIRLNVVRQTVSKWEQGLSVPDADLLIALSEVLETSVSTLLGDSVAAPQADGLQEIAEKLEDLNLRLAKGNRRKWAVLSRSLLALAVVTVALFALLLVLQSPYLGWDFRDPETAVAGTLFHAFEYLFARLAPFVFAGAVIGCIAARKKSLPRA